MVAAMDICEDGAEFDMGHEPLIHQKVVQPPAHVPLPQFLSHRPERKLLFVRVEVAEGVDAASL